MIEDKSVELPQNDQEKEPDLKKEENKEIKEETKEKQTIEVAAPTKIVNDGKIHEQILKSQEPKKIEKSPAEDL